MKSMYNNTQKIRENAVVDKKNAYVIYEWPLESMPAETDEEQDPNGLKSKYKLFPHQRQGLAWLIWRESHQPAG